MRATVEEIAIARPSTLYIYQCHNSPMNRIAMSLGQHNGMQITWQ
jgi:hypothetical protein